MKPPIMESCPCKSSLSYAECCLPLHDQVRQAETASQLMRSRYSAFSKELYSYLLLTHHPDYRQPDEAQMLRQNMVNTQWVSLSVMTAYRGSDKDKDGTVEFKAYYIEDGKPAVLHACSRFVRENESWFYTDDKFRHFSAVKQQRNEPCICQSGKKYKQCHGR